VALAAAVIAPLWALAADGPHDRRAAYDALAKLPDLDEGIWNIDWQARSRAKPPAPQPQPQLTAEYQARLEARRKAGLQNESANCLPPGMPGIMTWPYPFEFLYSPGRVTIAIESDSQVRRIYTDGRGHQADPDPAFNGDSIGHWEGDTLVVDTVGLAPQAAIAQGVTHSNGEHIVERFRLSEPDLLEVNTRVEDPAILAKPWAFTARYRRHPDWSIAEYICEQNNRNSVGADGKAGIDLTFKARP